MIKLTRKLPWSFTLAVSGGPDSMAALDFFKRGKKQLGLLLQHVNEPFGMCSRNVFPLEIWNRCEYSSKK